MATYEGPLPNATGFGMYQTHANQAYQQALARIQTQRSQLLRDSGYEGTYGDDGKLTDLKVASGAGSEFGGYQSLSRNMASQAEEGEAMERARGFTGGGLTQQANDDMSRDFAAQSNEFGQAVIGGIGELGQAEQQASTDYNNALYEQMLENIRNAAEGGQFNPLDPGGIGLPGYGQPYQPQIPGSGGFRPPTKPKPKPKPKPKSKKRRRR